MKLGLFCAFFKSSPQPKPIEPILAKPHQVARRQSVKDDRTAWWAEAQRDTYAMSSSSRDRATRSALGGRAIRELERDGLPVNERTLLERMQKIVHRHEVQTAAHKTSSALAS